MNILFLIDQLKDLVSDPLYIGLVRVLRQDCVVDYPSKAIFHHSGAKLWFLPQVPSVDHTEEQIRSLLARRFFDVVCVATPRPECLATLEKLYVPKCFPPIVFVDGADDHRIRHELVQRFPIAAYFKREYVWKANTKAGQFIHCARSFRFNRKLFAKTYPLPMSVVLDAIPQKETSAKDIDVSFYGHASHRKRAKAIGMLENLPKEGLRVAVGIFGAEADRKYKLEASTLRRLMSKVLDPSYLSEEETRRKLAPVDYYSTVARSKVGLSIRGGGFDTLRYWEIVACKTLLLSEAPNIVIPHNYEHRKHAVFCRPDLSDLLELVRYYVQHDDEREAIAVHGHAHLLKYHTCERRAEYFLGVCSSMI